MYDAKEAVLVQQASASKKKVYPTWAFPLFASVAMFTFAAVFVVRRTERRSTRRLQVVEPELHDEEALLVE